MDEKLPEPTPPELPAGERRRYPRVPARVEVRFEEPVHAARALRAYSLNLSAGGLCLRTQKDYEIGAPLKLTLVVGEMELQLNGAVAWTRGGAIGVRFDGVSEANRRRLDELSALLKK